MDSRVRPEFSERVIPIDGAIATRCAHLYNPDRNEADAITAATACVHGFAVVTREIQNFREPVLSLRIHVSPEVDTVRSEWPSVTRHHIQPYGVYII